MASESGKKLTQVIYIAARKYGLKNLLYYLGLPILVLLFFLMFIMVFFIPSQGVANSSISCGLITGRNNTEIGYKYFASNGDLQLKDFQAAAIVGNFIQESGKDPIDPLAYNSIFGATGVGQWLFGRLTRLKQHTYQGKDWTHLETQLDFTRLELTTDRENNLIALKATKNIRDATIVFENKFEVSGDTASYDQRVRYAESVLERYGRGNSPLCSDSIGDGTAQAIETTIRKYAEPNYHPADYINPLPAYVEAVQVAQAKGEYVGGGIHPGIDCGGFVMRVMRDSGADPDYNSYNGTTYYQKKYLDDHPEKYQSLGTYQTESEMQRKAQFGDIAINATHTFIYVGQLDGFNGTSASASWLSWRSPMASNTYVRNRAGLYYWYRLKR